MSDDNFEPDLDRELFRHLFDRRTILLGDPLEDRNSNRLCTALMVLSADDSVADITLLINSPGGSVPGMLAIRDCIRAISNDVATVNLGMAYSAGQFLLSAGSRGKRFAMPHSKVLLHQGSAGIGGVAADIAIQADNLRDTRDTVLGCIADDTGQSVATIERDSRRDRWFSAEEALQYGFVDRIVTSMTEVISSRATIRLGSGSTIESAERESAEHESAEHESTERQSTERQSTERQVRP